jgi:DNA primase
MARIPEELLDQIAAANDIVEVIGGYFPLKRAGTTYKALCPFHQERSPSFTVNQARQIFKCFGCGAGGSVFRFVMDYEHLDFTSAVRKLAERANIRLHLEEWSDADAQQNSLRSRLLAIHQQAAQFFHKNLLRSPAAQTAREYLKSRGIHAETARNWILGYAPDSWDATLRWARDAGFSLEEIRASGLVSQRDPESERSECYDRFRDRIMFPICNDTGEVIAFSGRILQPDAKAAKYVNSPETPLFTKGAVLFGLHRSKRALIQAKSAVVLEGQLDLISAFESGIQNVIAPQGTAFTPQQARILRRYVEEVVLCFDSDAAGEKATERSLPALLAERLGVRVCRLPQGEDPDSLIRSRGPEAFRDLLKEARDFFEEQLRTAAGRPDFATARGKTSAARKIAEFISQIGDPLLREMQVQHAAPQIGLGAPELARIVAEAAARNRAFQAPESRTPRDPGSDAQTPQAPRAAENPWEPLDQTVRLLALALMHSTEAREWVLEEDWRPRLAGEPQAGVLLAILEGHALLENAQGAQAFLSRQPADLEALLSGLLTEKAPDHPLAAAQDCFLEFQRRRLRRQMEDLKARQKRGAGSLEESTQLHQQILDLQKRLFDIARPFSPLR